MMRQNVMAEWMFMEAYRRLGVGARSEDTPKSDDLSLAFRRPSTRYPKITRSIRISN